MVSSKPKSKAAETSIYTLLVDVKFIFKHQYVPLSLPESTICAWTARQRLLISNNFQKCIVKHMCEFVVVDFVLLFAKKCYKAMFDFLAPGAA